MKYSSLRIDSPDRVFQWVEFSHASRPVDHDQSSAAEAGEGLTQPPPGNDPVTVKGLGRIDYNNVEITMQPSMLEPIIQNENGGRTALQNLTAGCIPVCRYSEPDLGNMSTDERWLIADIARRKVAARRNYPPRST
jgi:hypothetical protein